MRDSVSIEIHCLYWVSRLDWTLAWVEIPSRRWKSFKLISKPSEEQKIYSTRSCLTANEAEIYTVYQAELISQIAMQKRWDEVLFRNFHNEDAFFFKPLILCGRYSRLESGKFQTVAKHEQYWESILERDMKFMHH